MYGAEICGVKKKAIRLYIVVKAKKERKKIRVETGKISEKYEDRIKKSLNIKYCNNVRKKKKRA